MARYTDHNLNIPHHLFYNWTGWTSGGAVFPAIPKPVFLALGEAWASDGMECVAGKTEADAIHLSFKTQPGVAPTFLAQRAKGRLQHALRKAGIPVAFSRKLCVRSVGKNVRETVERYVEEQADRADLADERFRAFLNRKRVFDHAVDLSAPSEAVSGRYWYNLHVVMVTDRRYRLMLNESYDKLHTGFPAAAEEAGCRVARLSLMPDHAHVALRGAMEKSPMEIGLHLQNRTAESIGCSVWQQGFYAGTFGEYDLRAWTSVF